MVTNLGEKRKPEKKKECNLILAAFAELMRYAEGCMKNSLVFWNFRTSFSFCKRAQIFKEWMQNWS